MHAEGYTLNRTNQIMNPESDLNQTKIPERLELLRAELDKGQRHIDLLDGQRQEVRDTLLRISGAIQVLEELLHEPAEPASDIAPTSNGRRTPAELVTS
jgi:DNA-binding transcriptional MerR regulator